VEDLRHRAEQRELDGLDREVTGSGWPVGATVRRGGRLRRLSGVLVFVWPERAGLGEHVSPSPAMPGSHRAIAVPAVSDCAQRWETRSFVRPCAVGWPRVASAAPEASGCARAATPPFSVEPHASSESPGGGAGGGQRSDTDGIDTVRDNGRHNELGPGQVGTDPVSRETAPEVQPVPQPRMGDGSGPPPAVELNLSTTPGVKRTGTVYGRGAVPVEQGAPPADDESSTSARRTPPSPRPAGPVDTEVAMTDAYVSRETEDPPLALEAKRAV
jgi:hypothetical protein